MDEYLNEVRVQKIERTMKAFEKNNMKAYHAESIEDLQSIIESIIQKGEKISFGGSMSLMETSTLDFLRQGDYELLDRYEEGLTPEDIKKMYRESFFADTYFTSSNAITETGGLYNVDGRGNRVAAMTFGPDKVVVIAGVNKIVKDLDAAINRNKEVSGPANTKRLSIDAPCRSLGYCVDCDSKFRICNKYSFIKRDMDGNRFHIILMNEELGY